MVDERIVVELSVIDRFSATLTRFRRMLRRVQNQIAQKKAYSALRAMFGERVQRDISSVAKETTALGRNFQNLYWNVMGLTFALMGLVWQVGGFVDNVISATLQATEFSGGLAEAKAYMDSATDSFKIWLGTNSAFIEGVKNASSVLAGFISNVQNFLGNHPALLSAFTTVLVILLKLAPVVMALGQFFMFLWSAIRVGQLIIPVIQGLIGGLSLPMLGVGIAVVALAIAWKKNFLGIRDITAKIVAGIIVWFKVLWEAAAGKDRVP